MKYFCGTGAVATGTSPVEVHYGLSRRTILAICSTCDSHSRPTPRSIIDIFLSITFFYSTRVDAFEICSLVGWAI